MKKWMYGLGVFIFVGLLTLTGINVVRDGMRSTDDCVYDIYGRKVSRSGLPLPKGIYIIGGKKVLAARRAKGRKVLSA